MSADEKKRAVIYCDGASRGNPGEAAAGVAIWDERGESLGTVSLYLGRRTNNQAEYAALLAGVMSAQVLGLTDVEFRLDSELVVKQLNGEYRIKDASLRELAKRVKEAAARLSPSKGSGQARVRFVHVRRSSNREADELANEALDARGNL
ncbi:MAG: ribonuclease HI family protein [Chloroflexi bacterium]|nr:ribonuclease HI family protein [Chloroflexota bacterium]MCY3938245.1 ribonuclease HI family protein [Chloroflexota bacterium]